MKKWLEKLRNKNEIEKRNFALFSSILITFLIALVYFITVMATNSNQEQNQNIASPISSLKEMFGQIIDNNNY